MSVRKPGLTLNAQASKWWWLLNVVFMFFFPFWLFFFPQSSLVVYWDVGCPLLAKNNNTHKNPFLISEKSDKFPRLLYYLILYKQILRFPSFQ